MKYRKTFREALNDMGKKDKPEAKPEANIEKPVEDKDAIIKKLQDEIEELKTKAAETIASEPDGDTGEVPLRTGLAAALLSKSGPKPKTRKEIKTPVKLSSGKSKIEVNPDVDLGVFTGGNKASTGNLY